MVVKKGKDWYIEEKNGRYRLISTKFVFGGFWHSDYRLCIGDYLDYLHLIGEKVEHKQLDKKYGV